MRTRATLHVPVPIDAAYRFYADPARWALGENAPGYTIEPQGEMQEGAVLTMTGPGLRDPWHLEVTTLRPPHVVEAKVWRQRRPTQTTIVRYELQAVAGGTEVVEITDFSIGRLLGAAMWIARPVLALVARRAHAKQVRVIQEQYRADQLS